MTYQSANVCVCYKFKAGCDWKFVVLNAGQVGRIGLELDTKCELTWSSGGIFVLWATWVLQDCLHILSNNDFARPGIHHRFTHTFIRLLAQGCQSLDRPVGSLVQAKGRIGPLNSAASLNGCCNSVREPFVAAARFAACRAKVALSLSFELLWVLKS